MTHTLYSHDGSGGFAAEAALVKADAAYRTVVVDTEKGEQNQPDFAALNPMRQVPALVLPDGTLITESAAIVVHLAGAFPDKGLAPPAGSAGHGRFLRWMFFMAANLYEGDLRYYYPDRYTTDQPGIAGVKAAGAAHMRKSLAVIDQALADGPFLCGANPNMADCYLAMLTAWSPEPIAAPRLLAVRAAVAADPAIGPLWRRHGFDR
ncbi:MAG: glutathione S-transferase family protein [Dongiaceae bacterium]